MHNSYKKLLLKIGGRQFLVRPGRQVPQLRHYIYCNDAQKAQCWPSPTKDMQTEQQSMLENNGRSSFIRKQTTKY